jgi:hypothetical protein
VLIDVFRQDPFTAISLTAAVERNPFQPTGIGDLDIFEDEPVFTKTVMIEQRAGELVIIPTSPRGSAPVERVTEKRSARAFTTPRLAMGDTLEASEIDGIRAFGSESELMVAQAEIARRLSGPTGLQRNMEYTWELHRLGCVQGVVLDSDGSVIENWFTAFGISQPAEIPFNLQQSDPPDGALRVLCNQTVRAMARASKGAFLASTRVVGLCGDEFWDALTSHPDVTRTYYNWIAAQELRAGTAFEAMSFGGIDWVNYRGSDDNSTIAIPTDKVKFFPKGAPGVFKRALSPAETFDFVNTRGKPIYVIPIFDKDRNAWWRVEIYSYPLHICTRPEVLFSGRMGT